MAKPFLMNAWAWVLAGAGILCGQSSTLTITSPCPLPDASFRSPYTHELTATGGSSPYRWSIAQGNLPQGLSLELNGAFSGVVGGTGGDYNFTVRVTDSAAATADKPCRIRLVGPFRVQTLPLEFDVAAGAVLSIPYRVGVSSAVPSLAWTARAFAETGREWLRVTPSSPAVVPASIEVSVDASTLAPGSYSGSVRIQALNAEQVPHILPVTLRVASAPASRLTAEPAGVVTSVPRGSGLVRRALVLSAASALPVSFTATASTEDGANWLGVSSASGQVTPGAPIRIWLQFSTAALSTGAYRGQVRIVSGPANETLTIPVSLGIRPVQTAITLSQDTLAFEAIAGAPSAPAQEIRIGASGIGFSWEITTETAGARNWLSLGRTTGNANAVDVVPVTVRADPSGLSPGIHHGVVRVRSAATEPRDVPVTLRVRPAGTPATLGISSGGLFFTVRLLTAPAVTPPTPLQSLFLWNAGPEPQRVQWHLTPNNGVFVVRMPQGATIPPGGSLRVDVTTDFAGLTPGLHRAQIVLTSSSDPSVRNIDLALQLLPPILPSESDKPSQPARFTETGACEPGNVLLTAVQPAPGFAASAGTPVPIEVRATLGDSSPLVTGTMTAVFSSGGSPLNLQSLGRGVWAATWQVAHRSASRAAVTLYYDDPDLNRIGCVQVTGGIAANADAPILAESAALSAAAAQPYAPVAPGGIVSLFGTRLAAGTAAAPSLPLPTRLAGAEMLASGLPVPLYFAGELPGYSQINAQLPFGLAANAMSRIAVRTPAGLAFGEVLIGDAQPAVFSVNQTGQGQGVILNAAGVLADENNPVERGQVVVIYCEGLGATSPAVAAGQPAPRSPLATAHAAIGVTIGGQPAQLLYRGLTPALSGLYQINAIVPADAPTGPAVPVVVTAGPVRSAAVTMAVR